MQDPATGRPLCEGCHKPIPVYPGVPSGYVSPISEEYRDTVVDGIPGKENIAKVVCLDCYRTDFAKKYPGEECQV